MYCNKCGTQNSDNAVFCSKCGNKILSVKTENEPQKSYTHIENFTQENSGKQEPTGKLLHTIKKIGATYEIYDNKIIHKPLIGKIEYTFDKVVSAEFKTNFLGGVLTLKKNDGTSKVIPGLVEKDAEEILKYLPFKLSIQKKNVFTQAITIFVLFIILLYFIGVLNSQSNNADNNPISSIVSQQEQPSTKITIPDTPNDIRYKLNNCGTTLQCGELIDTNLNTVLSKKA